MYRHVFNEARDGLMIIDTQKKKLRDANKAMQQLTGYSKAELLAMDPHELSADPDDTKRMVKEALTAQGEMFVERLLKRKDGIIIPVEISARAIRIDGQMMAIGIFRDISERKRAEEEKTVLIGKLEKALAEVKQLSGLLPICSKCKKIRDENQSWRQLEDYIQEHSQALFSHGLCPECAERLYKNEDWYEE